MSEHELEYVGFWARVGATVIDVVLLCVITFPILTWIYGMDYWLTEEIVFIHGPADIVVNWVLPAIAIVLLWIYRQATPGKMAIGARIVDARTGARPSVRQCIIRYLAYVVSTIGLLLGYVWVGIDERKRGWHDMIAGTVVVRRSRGGGRPARFEQGRAPG
jgi:uncharacterized RDD family membrane protein YckC